MSSNHFVFLFLVSLIVKYIYKYQNYQNILIQTLNSIYTLCCFKNFACNYFFLAGDKDIIISVYNSLYIFVVEAFILNSLHSKCSYKCFRTLVIENPILSPCINSQILSLISEAGITEAAIIIHIYYPSKHTILFIRLWLYMLFCKKWRHIKKIYLISKNICPHYEAYARQSIHNRKQRHNPP